MRWAGVKASVTAMVRCFSPTLYTKVPTPHQGQSWKSGRGMLVVITLSSGSQEEHLQVFDADRAAALKVES